MRLKTESETGERRARKTLTPRFTDFFTDFEKKTDCFAVYDKIDKPTAHGSGKSLRLLVFLHTNDRQKHFGGQTDVKLKLNPLSLILQVTD